MLLKKILTLSLFSLSLNTFAADFTESFCRAGLGKKVTISSSTYAVQTLTIGQPYTASNSSNDLINYADLNLETLKNIQSIIPSVISGKIITYKYILSNINAFILETNSGNKVLAELSSKTGNLLILGDTDTCANKTGKVKGINSDNFNDIALKSNVPVLIYVYMSEGCAPCSKTTPTIESVAATVGDKALIVATAIDFDGKIMSKLSPYKLKGVPSFIILKDGNLVNSFAGTTEKETLINSL